NLDWIVEIEGEQAHAMRDANVAGALRYSAVENLGCWAVGIFFEEVMFNLPDVVDTDAVGQFDLRQRLPVDVVFAERMPRPRGFHFVEQSKFHMALSLPVTTNRLANKWKDCDWRDALVRAPARGPGRNVETMGSVISRA